MPPMASTDVATEPAARPGALATGNAVPFLTTGVTGQIMGGLPFFTLAVILSRAAQRRLE
jgi:hypothetical protein